MWSDPENIEAWAPNNRGAGWIFGTRVVRDFNYINGLELIARAHQLVQEGFQFWFQPRNLVTIWSAPNYCYRCNNVASIMKVTDKMAKEFCIFQSVP
jgi:diadenosine tetraphosphatase ApaH/serine/threonine PP2A family protein phosphatase